MIESLFGTVKQKRQLKGFIVVIEVSGIGYRVSVHSRCFENIPQGKRIEIFTYLHIQENDMELFGFLDQREADFFRILLGVPGIGPKTALNILGKTDIAQIREAVVKQDPRILIHTGGLTKLLSEKIVFGLKGSIGDISVEGGSLERTREDAAVVEALVHLGFSADQARKAVSRIPPAIHGIEAKIKEALKFLGKA